MPDEKDLMRAKMRRAQLTIRTPEVKVLDSSMDLLDRAVECMLNILTQKYQYTLTKLKKEEQQAKLAEFLKADYAEASRLVREASKKLELSLHDLKKLNKMDAAIAKKIKDHINRVADQEKVLRETIAKLNALAGELEKMTTTSADLEKSATSFKSRLMELIAVIGVERAKRTALLYLYSSEIK